ncbi:MAG: hypothetical protein ABI899_12525 [Actinomycetota bacterium]
MTRWAALGVPRVLPRRDLHDAGHRRHLGLVVEGELAEELAGWVVDDGDVSVCRG